MILKFFKRIILLFLLLQNILIESKRHNKRKLVGAAMAGAGGDSKDPDEFKASDDPDLSASGSSIGIVMRVDRPEDAKPVYINMSPMYDFRNHLIQIIEQI